MSTAYAGMTKTEKFSQPYSPEDVDLLVALRSQKPPMGWTQIQRTYFPDRSPAALKARVYALPDEQRPPLGPTGRAPGCEPNENTPDSDAWERRAMEASSKLGAAIEAMIARCGVQVLA